MEKLRVTVWIYASQAGQLDLLKRQQRKEQAATIDEFMREGRTRRDARILVARMRPTEWPGLDVLVARAIEQRLEQPDLAGPWRPLTTAEEEQLALAGRWPGPSRGVSMRQRNYQLPADLVRQLRTAAWRVSEEPLRELRKARLVGAGVVLSESEKARRDQLAERLYPVPRIVREALARYGPGAPGE